MLQLVVDGGRMSCMMWLLSGPIEEISMQELRAAIHKMKNGKSTGITGVAAEMLKASGDSEARWMTDLFNTVVK